MSEGYFFHLPQFVLPRRLHHVPQSQCITLLRENQHFRNGLPLETLLVSLSEEIAMIQTDRRLKTWPFYCLCLATLHLYPKDFVRLHIHPKLGIAPDPGRASDNSHWLGLRAIHSLIFPYRGTGKLCFNRFSRSFSARNVSVRSAVLEFQ